MRVKTEARRQAILDAAAEVFREEGFEGATMSAICERVGGSKATLYGYFASKEELFVATALRELEAEGEQIFEEMAQESDLRAALERAGAAFLKVRLSPKHLAIQRLIQSQCDGSDLGPMFYQLGPCRKLQRAADYLRSLMDAGRLRRADPWTCAVQLKALFEAGVVDRAVFGLQTELTEDELRAAAHAAADTFLRAYGVEPAKDAA